MKLKNLKQIRKRVGVSQETVARSLNLPLSTYRSWEQQKFNPRSNELKSLADYFSCTIDDLFGRPSTVGLSALNNNLVPCYDRIPANTPLNESKIVKEIEIPAGMRAKYPDAFFLLVSDNSMDRIVLENSYALIDPKSDIENVDTVALNIDNHDAVLKVMYKSSNTVVLSPNSTDPEHMDIIIDANDLAEPDIRILGKVVWALYPEL
jgi:repressor LexA